MEGAQLAFPLAVDATFSSLFHLVTDCFSLGVIFFLLQPFLRDGGGYYRKHEHQKVGDSGSYSAFVSGVCLHGRRFNW